jgi:hypothetical protein
VRIRTSKQVRIRGMSSTASAVLACFMGWGDISSHMLTDRAKPPFPGAVDFGNLSTDTGKPVTTTKAGDDGGLTDAEIESAAAQTELPPGWRGAIISGVAQEVAAFLDVAAVGASSLYTKWSDGLTAKDVEDLGAQFGKDLSTYAAGLFNAAANATSPPDTPVNGGE